ncbi:PDR/VanB family oxidoreductase [Cellulomonas marina]|uniref:Ferredoxin-NADP reductase n=1 Tax=Cellulomonas marina TaxID=988821 RepID=A0A1I0V954_9CELL|nr:PDR/VanB family oxidoreductase [Cellulomonas marina]GIG29222.1 ferredoxin [Cellulomonas marina]SFA72587.1 Ferredoxin-NADP reductase [Cellulomonas marina]
MSVADTAYDVVVAARTPIADGVVLLDLARADGLPLPGWVPGAHVDLVLGTGSDALERQYSLCGVPGAPVWQVAVLLEPGGRGGSVRAHALAVGDALVVRGPRNLFAYDASDWATSGPVLFVAGGIGITPLLPMVRSAAAAGHDWRLVHAGRSRRTLAFSAALADEHPDRVRLHVGDEGDRLDVAALLAATDPAATVYCCGPARLMEAVEAASATRRAGSLHLERFVPRDVGEPVLAGPFEVELELSGLTLTVPPERSVLDVVEEAGVLVLSSCREGTCGTCETPVLEGEVDHRDSVLTADERADGRAMMICVSRAACPRLVLEL